MKKQLGYIRKFLMSFTSVFTCVIIASTIFIRLYSNPYLPFKLIAQAAIIAAVSSVLNFIYYSEHPISKKSMIIRTTIHFFLLISTVTGCALYFEWFSFENNGVVLTFFGLLVAVYLIVWLMNFLGDSKDEKIMNQKLKEYKARQK
ncbi:MAG: hypothetical protein CVU91_04260 [Firmicutes bacterium HGW-Firmicutes-16]|nr:MAG: hypothetical protein CVU91_04260 [Firmicutes bacterium HGW-Firmicutes-16]